MRQQHRQTKNNPRIQDTKNKPRKKQPKGSPLFNPAKNIEQSSTSNWELYDYQNSEH
jgi:hypothetical protein